MPKFGTKNALLRYLWAKMLKTCCHILNQHLQICLITKFYQKKKKSLNLGPKMPYLGIFEQEFFKSIVIFEISTLAKFYENKNKNP